MKPPERSILGIWVISLIFLFGLFFNLIVYYTLQLTAGEGNGGKGLNFLSLFNVVSSLVLIAEIVVYWVIRNRIRKLLFVRLHVWLLFAAVVALPITHALGLVWVAKYYSPDHYYTFSSQSWTIRLYLFWLLIIASHIFFVMTMVHSFGSKQETNENEESTGILDEFVDEC